MCKQNAGGRRINTKVPRSSSTYRVGTEAARTWRRDTDASEKSLKTRFALKFLQVVWIRPVLLETPLLGNSPTAVHRGRPEDVWAPLGRPLDRRRDASGSRGVSGRRCCLRLLPRAHYTFQGAAETRSRTWPATWPPRSPRVLGRIAGCSDDDDGGGGGTTSAAGVACPVADVYLRARSRSRHLVRSVLARDGRRHDGFGVNLGGKRKDGILLLEAVGDQRGGRVCVEGCALGWTWAG